MASWVPVTPPHSTCPEVRERGWPHRTTLVRPAPVANTQPRECRPVESSSIWHADLFLPQPPAGEGWGGTGRVTLACGNFVHSSLTSQVRTTTSGSSSTKTATGCDPWSRATAAIARAVWRLTERLALGQRIIPTISAPAIATSLASSTDVTPQTFNSVLCKVPHSSKVLRTTAGVCPWLAALRDYHAKRVDVCNDSSLSWDAALSWNPLAPRHSWTTSWFSATSAKVGNVFVGCGASHGDLPGSGANRLSLVQASK
jgi:hypothetical protein